MQADKGEDGEMLCLIVSDSPFQVRLGLVARLCDVYDSLLMRFLYAELFWLSWK